MSIVTELPAQRVRWWVRRCLRSRKLSRWFLPTLVRHLRPVADHNAAPGCDPETWLPRCEFTEPPPKATVGDFAGALRTRPADTTHPAVTRRVLRDVRLHGLSNLVHAGDKVVLHGDMVRVASDRLPEEYQRGVRVDADTGTICWPNLGLHGHRIDEAVSLLDATAPNYAHWLTEILPKAALWTRFGRRPDVPLLVDAGLHANIMRALDLVVARDQRVTLVRSGQVVHVARLHQLSAPGYIPFEPRARDGMQRSHGTFSAEALRIMIDFVKRGLGLSDADPQDAVVFVRRTSSIRNVLNEDELNDFLARQGWPVVAPETLSFDDQVRLFHRARLVVGPTGAALANLLFARPGCRVGVMMPTHACTPYFYWHNLARTRGVRIEYILCQPEAGSPHGVHSHFTAPVAEMARSYGAERCKAAA